MLRPLQHRAPPPPGLNELRWCPELTEHEPCYIHLFKNNKNVIPLMLCQFFPRYWTRYFSEVSWKSQYCADSKVSRSKPPLTETPVALQLFSLRADRQKIWYDSNIWETDLLMPNTKNYIWGMEVFGEVDVLENRSAFQKCSVVYTHTLHTLHSTLSGRKVSVDCIQILI